MPKREKSKLSRIWEHFAEVKAATAKHGVLLPQHYAATLLSVSNQRVHQLVNDGRLMTVEVGGLRYVTENSMTAYAQSERKAGRPPKIPSLKAIFGKARESVQDTASKIV